MTYYGEKVNQFGTVAQPTSGLVTVRNKGGTFPNFALEFTLTAARIVVTDAAASGSSGSLKLFDFVKGGITILGCYQNYTAFAEGSALTTAAGDAAFIMALGTVAADAGDAALTSTEVNIGAATSTITLSGGTGTGTKMSGALTTVLDGSATAVDLLLNWSGSAATIDATSYIDVTGVITVVGTMIYPTV